MLITKTKPVGIDNAIQKLQVDLHGKLMAVWGLNVNNDTQNALYESYGRCYRNKKDNGYIAEVFTGGIDYKDVYWNDSLYALSFFGVNGPVIDELGQGKANIHLVFFVNLAKLKPTIAHRADEEVREDVINAIGAFNNGFKLVSYETGIDNVLREYPVSRESLAIKADMHPSHSFRMNLTVLYKNNNC